MEDVSHDQLASGKDAADSFPESRSSSSSDVIEGAINCSKECEDYPMKKGMCYIFNQRVFQIKNELFCENTELKKRTGTNVDADLLERFFKAINFDVYRFDDCDYDKIGYYLQTVCQKGFSEYSCFVCCILSYEAEPNILYAKDRTYPTKRVFERFHADKCPSLIGKPKIFFIQACANESDPSVQRTVRQSTDSGLDDSYEIHTVADFLVVYSTAPGFYSWENTSKGSWFIEALVQSLFKQTENMDLLQVLNIVTRKVLFDYQKHFGRKGMELARVPCVTSTLTRNIKLPVPFSLESEFLNSDSEFSYESENYALNCTREGTSKGKVYIFNHKKFIANDERLGTNMDVEKLKEFFRKPYFEVQTFRDLGKEEILKEITNVASISHENFWCFICCILTHGDDGTLSANDKYYEINDIFSPFFDKWVGKPKIYFIQACRGNLLNSGVRVLCKKSTDSGDGAVLPTFRSRNMQPTGSGDTNDYNFMTFTRPDFLIANSTVPGNASLRNENNGSWFIQTLCNTLKKHGQNMNLQQLLTIVHHDVSIEFKSNCHDKKKSNKKQVPCLTSTMTKNVKF